MATPSPAAQAWHHAAKLRKHLQKQLDRVKASAVSGLDVEQMEAVESTLEQYGPPSCWDLPVSVSTNVLLDSASLPYKPFSSISNTLLTNMLKKPSGPCIY